VTDKTDARELTLNLDRYLRGNLRALSVVRVPTPAEEQRRALSRQREQLRWERQRLAAQGRGLCLTQGIRLRGEWWKGNCCGRARRPYPIMLKRRRPNRGPILFTS